MNQTKTNNQPTVMAIIAIITLALAFACKPDPAPDNNEQPQYREATITLNFGTNAYDIKVSGTLLASEWNGVPSKVESILETAYPANPQTIDDSDEQDNFKLLFEKTGANVIVEKATAYTTYKTIGDGITLYLCFSSLNSISSEFVTSEHLNHSTYGKKISIIYDAILRILSEAPYTPLYTNPAPITQGTPNGLAFAGSVTIKSDDTYTPAEWDAVVAKVVAALNRGYSVDDGDGLNELMFEDVFNRGNSSVDIEVLVLKSASYNIEVKSGEYGKLYLKESSLDTINVKDAVWAMSDGLNGEDGEYQANAAPPKRRAFLANGLNVTPSACPA